MHLFLGVAEAIVGSLKCCVVGIAKCLFHFFITRHLVIAPKPPKLQSLWCSADCVLQLTYTIILVQAIDKVFSVGGSGRGVKCKTGGNVRQKI